MFCTKCGNRLNNDDSFCASCGFKNKASDQDILGYGLAKAAMVNPELLEAIAIIQTSEKIESILGKEKADKFINDKLGELKAKSIPPVDEKLDSTSSSLISKIRVVDTGFSNTPSNQIGDKPLHKVILDGEWGLLRTFFVFGVVLFFFFALLRTLSQNENSEITLFYLVFVIYSFIAAVIIGKAANKYQGPKIWKFLVFVYILVLLLTQPLGFILDLLGA
jgi:hypothetical protein